MAQSSSENPGARLRPYLWWIAAFAVLLAGYADLWRGGLDAAAGAPALQARAPRGPERGTE